EIGRDLLDLVVLALLRLTTPGEGLHADQIDNTLEVALSADPQLDDERPRAETLLDGADRVVEVGAELVHLVDEADTRNLVLVRLPPNLLGLRLDTFLAVEDGDGTVEHTQRTLHLNSEVDVAGCVDDVDLVVVPEGGGSSRGNSDTPLLLLLHPVHRRRTLMSLTELVVDPGVEQDPLGGGGLTGVDVGHDADVSDLVEVCQHVTCHLMFPCLKRGTRHWLRS